MIRPLTVSLATVTVSLLALTGCPSSVTIASEIENESAPRSACSVYLDALVERDARCSSREMSAASRARYEQLCENNLAAPGVVDGSASLARCADATRSTACDREPECEVDPGELPGGAACGIDAQCQSASCVKSGSDSCGTCAEHAPVGAPCDRLECVEGSRCVLLPGGETKCVALSIRKAGESCLEETSACDKGLRCVTDESAKATCLPLGEAGAACEENTACADGLRCIRLKCAAPLAEGVPCLVVRDECEVGLGCDRTERTCRKIVDVAAGAACDPLTRRCAQGICQGSSITGDERNAVITPGTCVEPLADGAACKERGAPGHAESPPCDAPAACIAGKCALPDPSQCK
ncbi:MAG: hypothetical protein KF795_21120 [Labilithrix sp.]|nr:hypothetical protein [Labilithrix sp.]